jgi:hypothetical protein
MIAPDLRGPTVLLVGAALALGALVSRPPVSGPIHASARAGAFAGASMATGRGTPTGPAKALTAPRVSGVPLASE